jgi:large subunit ribosomal protein L5
MNFRNITKLERVTVHTMVSDAMDDSAHLHVAGMIVQAITGVRATACKAKKNVSGFNIREGRYISVKAELTGETMYHFLTRLIDVVLPKIKDWKGAKGSSGDSSGNISFGLTPETVGLFPEVEVNYDMCVCSAYPFVLVPGYRNGQIS